MNGPYSIEKWTICVRRLNAQRIVVYISDKTQFSKTGAVRFKVNRVLKTLFIDVQYAEYNIQFSILIWVWPTYRTATVIGANKGFIALTNSINLIGSFLWNVLNMQRAIWTEIRFFFII